MIFFLISKFKLQDLALSHKWQTIDNSLYILILDCFEKLGKKKEADDIAPDCIYKVYKGAKLASASKYPKISGLEASCTASL